MKFNKFLILLVVFALALCITAMGSVSAAAAGNNSTTQGQSEYTGPQTNTTKFVNTSIGGAITTIAEDGTMYVRSGTGGTLYAMNSNREVLWNCSVGAKVSKPVIGPDGVIYTYSNTILYAIYPNGTSKWNYTIPGGVNQFYDPPVIGSDTIYMGAAEKILAIDSNDPNGQDPKWIFNTGTNQRSGPVLSPDEKILYFGSYGAYTFYALDTNPNATQRVIWSYVMGTSYTDGGAQSAPVIGPDGTIYIGVSGHFFAFDPDPNATNHVKWTVNLTNPSTGSILGVAGAVTPVIASDGTIYMAAGAFLYALYSDPNATDHVKWISDLGTIPTTPVIGADGTIYLGLTMTSRSFVAVNPNGTVKWRYTLASGNGGYYPEIGSDGTLYIGATGGWYAFQDLIGNFTSTLGSGLDVSFTDTSSNLPSIWIWDFGDGSEGSDLQNPTHIYSAPGVYNVTLTVITNGGDSTTMSKLVTVNPAPTLSPIGNKAVDENKPLIFTVNGSDLYGDELTYSATGLPQGATFNSATGAFSWTPTYSQAGTYTVTFYVSDGNSIVSETITLTVNNVNRAPTLSTIGNKVVDENKPLTFTVGGSDLDGDNLTYTVTGLPTGATFNSATGVFSWTPTFSQAGTYTVTFRVSDDSLTASETITITVKDVDNVAPKVSKVDPANNAAVKTAKTIKVTFNEPIKAGSLWIDFKNSSGKAVPFTSSISGNVLTITPKSILGSGKYNLALHTGAITDLAGNALAVYSSSFTVDSVAPKVSKVDPAKNAVVKAAKAIKVTFNESVKLGAKAIILRNSSGKAVSFNRSISGKVLTITPKSALGNGKYTLTLQAGSVTDLVGNALALFSTAFTVDKSAPTVTKSDPVNGAVKVSAGKTIKVTFSEAIQKGSKKVELKNSSNRAIAFTSSISGKVLTIKPKSKLAESKYRLILNTGSIADKAGNLLKAKTISFTVGTPPKVSKIDPKSGATKVARSKVVKVTFNEVIKKGSNFKVELRTVKGNKLVKLTKSISGKVLTLKHAKLAANTKYKLTLYTGSVTDKAGNPVAAKTYTFTTGKT